MNPRHIGDAPVDALVATHGAAALPLIERMSCNAAEIPEDAPRPVAEWLAQARVLPSWAWPARILRAQRWADRHLVLLVTGLFCASLPSAYAAANGARVLYATGRLKADVDRRVHETGAFVLDVLRPEGFAPSGRSMLSACRVRWVHALVRARVAMSEDEVPINQEDLVGTLLTFSVLLVDALRNMGVRVSHREDADYFHLWRVVGALLGIEERRLPMNAAEARVVARRIGERELRPSPEGRELAEVLFERMGDHMPATMARGWPRALSYRLLDARVRGALSLREGPSWADLLPLRGSELRVVARGTARMAENVGRPLVASLLAAKLASRRR